MGSAVVRRQRDGLAQALFGTGPVVLEIEAVTQVAVEISVFRLEGQCILVILCRIGELIAPVVQDREPPQGVRTTRIMLEGFVVRDNGLFSFIMLFQRPSDGNLNVG